MTDKITVPTGCTIALSDLGQAHVVFVAPPGVTPGLGMLMGRGAVSGVFTFDGDLTWPNSPECATATAYLAAGCPIALFFENADCAAACHERLVREAGQ